jgi:macrodomain Ter protein organizer (MatP/YcbG family)
MALGKDKTRILVNLPIELKQELETYAKQNNRSLSNYIVYLISKYKDQEQEKGL